MDLSLDVGTSAVKVALVDQGLREVASATRPYPLIMASGSRVEMDPQAVFAAIATAVADLGRDRLAQVDRLVYDTFSPSLVLIGADGELVYPRIITHLDRRSAAQSQWIVDQIGADRFLAITGMLPFIGGSAAVTLRWFVDHEPELLARVGGVNHLAGYLHHRLTGQWLTDRVNASMMGLAHTTTDSAWSTDLIAALGFDRDWFGPIRNPGEPAGGLTAAAARWLGLPAGLPVTVGTNDMAASQVGAGNTRPGQIMNAAGSSDMVSILTDVAEVNPRYYLRNAALPGTWQIYATTVGGFALDWFQDQFARELSPADFYGPYLDAVVDAVLADPAAAPPVEFEPYLSGDRQSLSPKTAAWRGLTLAATREQMLGAILTAIAQTLGHTIELARAHTRLDQTIKLSGGLATDPLLRLKRAAWPGFDFVPVHNCAILGNVRLAQLAEA